MSASVPVGKYQISFESRGLRLQRIGESGPVVVTPLLMFTITEAGSPAAIFQIQRLVPAGTNAADFHGFTSQRLALYGRISAISDGIDALRVEMRVENAIDEMRVRVSAQLVLTGEADPRWLVPGVFYGNNRPPGSTRVYPTYSEINRDLRKLVSNNWTLRSDRAATPLVCAWTYGCMGYISTQGMFGRSAANPDGVGMSGLQFGSDEGQPTLGVDFPYRETPVKFSFCHEDKIEPEETFVVLPKATPMVTSFLVGVDQPDLHAHAKVIRHLYYADEKDNPPATAEVPMEVQEQIAHTGLLRWHFDSRQAALYESASFDRHFGRKGMYTERAHMHAGWLSGALPAYSLLYAGRESKHVESVNAGVAVLNKLAGTIAPAGTIFPAWTEENGWSCSFGPEDGTAHSRTVAEAVLFILRALGLEIKNNANHQQWYEAALSSLNYAMGAQREDGAFPCYYDLTTGRPTSFDGCGGLPWIAAFAAGSSLLQKPHFREVAIKAGDYYARFVRNGLLYGTVEDLNCVPTSDDCHWALIAYINLYELDRDTKWLSLAKKAADLALTWRFSYNVKFSRNTMLGRYGIATRGGDITSVASPATSCQGLISYREMTKLAHFAGDEYYQKRAEDARSFAQQLIVREDGHYNGREGMAVGLLFHTDWWQPKGMLLSLSNTMTGGLFKYAQIQHRLLRVSAHAVEEARDEHDANWLNDPVYFADADVPEEAGLGGIGGGLMSALGISDKTPLRTSRADVLKPAGAAAQAAPPTPALGQSGFFNLPGIPNPGAPSKEAPKLDPLAPAASSASSPRLPMGSQSRQDVPRPGSRDLAPGSRGSGSRSDVQIPGGMTERLGAILGLGGGPPSSTSNRRSSRGSLSGDHVPLPGAAKNEPAPLPNFSPPSGTGNPKPLAEQPRESDGRSDEEIEIKYKIF
ncbi:hypothetical protein IT571_02760 [Candidatus Sumerlaeota bacterium]|nr:hypothetical protein [Candidatus Sumerlaeota bacterium]